MFFRDYHRTITCYYEKLTGAVCDKYNLTQMEYDILMFLHNNPQYNTAAEIVKIRRSTKSHVSTSLRMLEEKGLIEKRQSEDNKKYIAIILLDKAKTIVNEGIAVRKGYTGRTFRRGNGYVQGGIRKNLRKCGKTSETI